MTESIEPDSVDHVGKKFFSTPKTKYFSFDKLWYYACLSSKNQAIQKFDAEFKAEIEKCSN